MGATRCSTCGKVKFNAYFYRRKDRKAVNQPCRSCSKKKALAFYYKKRGGENING